MTDEPAFPCATNLRETYWGLTKRQLIAAIILGGIVSHEGIAFDHVQLALDAADNLLRQTEAKP